ncbi:peritrophin-44-like [Musca autumnalis]|uniref:peritrophin-44-like n=1 Tax=Musca autumnalis TaxID=221902 RepID=UPI003CF7BEE3
MFKSPRALDFNALLSTLLLITLTSPQLVVVAQSTSEFIPEELCPLLPYDTKIKDPRFCNVYIDCYNETSTTDNCGAQFFNRNTGECVDPLTIECLSSDPCAKRPTGFVDDPYSCNYYYYCANGKGTRGECSAGLNYNPETSNCVRNFPCEKTMLPEDYCNIVPEGVFIKVPGSCEAYQVCWQSQLLNGTCPPGFYYDSYRGGCDYPSHVDCRDTSIPDAPEDVKCTQAGEFISDGVSCDGYFYCGVNADEEFTMTHGRCPVDRFFDASEGGQCAPRTDIKCSHDRCVTLGMDYIQMANENSDGCNGFLLCQSGKTIGRASCPEGQYFDEWSQLCVERVIDFVACAEGEGSVMGVAAQTRSMKKSLKSRALASSVPTPPILSPVLTPRNA